MVTGYGYFKEKEHGHWFDYQDADYTPFVGFDKIVKIGNNTNETRFAKILKTVAYVVVDEAANGMPIVEKWQLKKNIELDK